MPPRANQKTGAEVVSLTPEEADAAICKETGMTMEEVYALNLYEKRLLMGWKPKPTPKEMESTMQSQMRMMAMRAEAQRRAQAAQNAKRNEGAPRGR
jgi:hypothetical protein